MLHTSYIIKQAIYWFGRLDKIYFQLGFTRNLQFLLTMRSLCLSTRRKGPCLVGPFTAIVKTLSMVRFAALILNLIPPGPCARLLHPVCGRGTLGHLPPGAVRAAGGGGAAGGRGGESRPSQDRHRLPLGHDEAPVPLRQHQEPPGEPREVGNEEHINRYFHHSCQDHIRRLVLARIENFSKVYF